MTSFGEAARYAAAVAAGGLDLATVGLLTEAAGLLVVAVGDTSVVRRTGA